MMTRKTKKASAIDVPSEHAEQCALIKWWSLECKRLGVPENLLFAIPNGGARSAITGATLKAEGVRAGAPDLFLAVSGAGKHGLFIEMKRRRGGVVSAPQKEIKAELERFGYSVEVCCGFDEARAAILEYFGYSQKKVFIS